MIQDLARNIRGDTCNHLVAETVDGSVDMFRVHCALQERGNHSCQLILRTVHEAERQGMANAVVLPHEVLNGGRQQIFPCARMKPECDMKRCLGAALSGM